MDKNTVEKFEVDPNTEKAMNFKNYPNTTEWKSKRLAYLWRMRRNSYRDFHRFGFGVELMDFYDFVGLSDEIHSLATRIYCNVK